MQMTMTLSYWDWMVIAFYFAFILGVGFLFKHVSRNSSDYFRGGGNMLWWLAGMSSIMAGLSTWSFTGAAAKVYETGFLLPFTWIVGIPIIIPILWFMAPRFRQMRVVTSIEAVFRRFGFGTEQFYTYMVLPMGLFFGGVGLNTIAVFMSAAFGLDMLVALIGIGVVVTVMCMAGGQWAVAASDFVQGLVLFLIVGVVIYLSLNLPEIGGITNLPKALPREHMDFSLGAREGIVWLWILTMLISAVLNCLNMHGEGAKYLLVKDGRQARGMVVLRLVLSVLIPTGVLLQIPSMCAATVYPDMSSVFPHLKVPEEGAFVAMAFKTLPQGLMGLLICGMFAASMSSMDTALNRNAGYFVRNVYIKYLHRGASETQQLFMGKLFTLVFGLIMILVGIAFDALREVNLFDVFLLVNAMILLPSVVPVALGMVIKRTPAWSGWSTILVGMGAGAVAKSLYSPELFRQLMGYATSLSKREIVDSEFIFVSVFVLSAATAWFLMTMLFYKQSHAEHHERVDKFFQDMRTPIDHVKEDVRDQDAMQYRLVGIMCLVFGGFTLLGMLIPNPLTGRLGFLFVGGTIFALGIWLYIISIRKFRTDPDAEI
jgi:SSS family solute:Na+ symporter